MRCGLSPIVAMSMRKTRESSCCGEQERICYLLGIFTVFFRFPPFSPVFPGKVNHFAANSRHFPPPPAQHTLPPIRGLRLLRKQARGFSGNKLTVPVETSSVHPRFFYFTFYRLMIIFVGCFGIEIKQICLHLNC